MELTISLILSLFLALWGVYQIFLRNQLKQDFDSIYNSYGEKSSELFHTKQDLRLTKQNLGYAQKRVSELEVKLAKATGDKKVLRGRKFKS